MESIVLEKRYGVIDSPLAGKTNGQTAKTNATIDITNAAHDVFDIVDDDGYRREKRSLEDKLANLVVPGVDAAMEAGKLLEDLPVLWEEADLTEKRKLLMAMLEAVYVDTVEEKSVVAIRPKPAFRPIFEVATTREGSGIALINQTPQTQNEPEASESCSWWRRGRV